MNFRSITSYITGQTDEPPSSIGGTRNLNALESLSIYRSDYLARMHSALKSAYPVTWHIVGDEAFEQLAMEYLRAHPSTSWDLNVFGAELPQHLELGFSRTLIEELPFLTDLTKLEWASHLYFHQAPPKDAINQLPQSEQELASLRLHPSLRIFCSQFQIPLIYRAGQRGDEQLPAEWSQGSYYFLSKSQWLVQLEVINSHEYLLLSQWQQHQTLGSTLAFIESQYPDQLADLSAVVGATLYRLFQNRFLTLR